MKIRNLISNFYELLNSKIKTRDELLHKMMYNESDFEKNMIKPCDCIDQANINRLNEQGIGHNNQSIMLDGGRVILIMDHTTIIIPGRRFKMFAEWYLEPQEIKKI